MQASNWDHIAMTTKQQQLFRELAAGGLPNTLAEHERIALEALRAGNVPDDLAAWMVQLSVAQLQNWGAVPVRIPWVK